MDYIIKSAEEAQARMAEAMPKPPARFAVYTLEDAVDENDQPVKIQRNQGFVTVEELERRKTELTAQIAEIDAKLLAIANL